PPSVAPRSRTASRISSPGCPIPRWCPGSLDGENLEHRVAVGLGHEVLHRSVLVRTKVRPGGCGNADIALEHRPSLPSRDLADGIVTPVAAAAQGHPTGGAGVMRPLHL